MIEEWVKGKEKAEAIAVELAKDYIEETPKPIDQSNYLQVRALTRVFPVYILAGFKRPR